MTRQDLPITILLLACLTLSLFAAFAPGVAELNSLSKLLNSNGLPAGIFPASVKSFSLDNENRLEVQLEQACFAEFENVVYFERVVKANLTYGGLVGLEGIEEKELFLWLPIKGIIVDDLASGLILIDIGVAHQQVSLSLFEEPPVCLPNPREGSTRMSGKDYEYI